MNLYEKIAYDVLNKMGILPNNGEAGIFLKNDDSGKYEKVTKDFFDFLLSDEQLFVDPPQIQLKATKIDNVSDATLLCKTDDSEFLPFAC